MRSIVIVGGGFAGFNAALAAQRVADGRCEIALVSREPVMTIRPRLYEGNPQTLVADLLAPLHAIGATFVADEVSAIDGDHITLASGQALAFDRLVVATGSVMRRPAVPGAELAHSIDDRPTAVAFDRALAELGHAVPARIVVVGAGFTGIELALELRDRIATHHGEAAGERAEIAVVDRAAAVGAELGPGPRGAIERALADARVTCRLGADISAIAPTAVTFSSGERLECDVVVLCTGLRAAPLVGKVPGAKDAVGRLVVDPFLRAPAAPHIFVAGDAAAAVPEPGRVTLLSCQHALTLGRFAGANAAADALGLPMRAYAQPRYVTCLALGRSGAVFCEGWERVPKMTGEKAKALKTEINSRRIYPPAGGRDALLASAALP